MAGNSTVLGWFPSLGRLVFFALGTRWLRWVRRRERRLGESGTLCYGGRREEKILWEVGVWRILVRMGKVGKVGKVGSKGEWD